MAVYLGSNKVDVFGGKAQDKNPHIVAGTFKDTSGVSGTLDINLPYTGNGYPIGVWIHAADWSNIASLIHKGGVLDCVIWKSYESTAPGYAGRTGSSDEALKDRTGLMLHYKSSTSSGTSTTVYKVPGSDSSQANYRPAPATSNYRHLCAITSATNLKVAISGASETNGFMTGVEYRYVVVYSE